MESKNVILHICNGFYGSKVHQELYRHLESDGISQIIYVPLNRKYANKELPTSVDLHFKNTEIVNSVQLKKRHSFMYLKKISSLYHDLIYKLDISNFSLVHATTLCVDGAVAFELNQHYKVPYIVTVRNTDINAYYKYFFMHRGYFEKILKSASKVVFISECYKMKFFSQILKNKISSFDLNNFEVIGNGIDNVFLKNRKYKAKSHIPTRALFVGRLDYNKNILSVIKAISILNNRGYNLTYTVIGYDKDIPNKWQDKILAFKYKYEWFEVVEKQTKEALLEIISEYDFFVMTSFYETFGLVYIEALSQGLPIIYTSGEGFDNTFPNGQVGYSANARSLNSISEAIEKVVVEYDNLLKGIRKVSLERFLWPKIAMKYIEIYNDIKSNN